MYITLLNDKPDGWLHKYVTNIESKLKATEHSVKTIYNYKSLEEGDIAFFIGCSKIVPPEFLRLNKHNLVVHASNLPKGKGFSPYTWQILEGKDTVPITLFEAEEELDSGQIYYQEKVKFEGHELISEIREKIGEATVNLSMKFIEDFPDIQGHAQEGEETFYPKRTPKDSEIDPSKPILEQFNQFRVADNERYPVFFEHKGHKYVLKIYKEENIS